MDRTQPWLRYVEARDLDSQDEPISLDDLEVDDSSGRKLGNIEGFIVEVDSGHPHHVVVGAGHWFAHKHVLVPIGHAVLDATGKKLVAEVSKERLNRVPGFDTNQFERLSSDDLRRIGKRLAAASAINQYD